MASISNQCTNTVLMIRPVQFRMNEQTAVDNHYQQSAAATVTPENVNSLAQAQFDGLVSKLRSVGVRVLVLNDRLEADTPDSIFPNNWITMHSDGRIVTYPMFTPNRRRERRLDDVLQLLRGDLGENAQFNQNDKIVKFQVTSTIDYSHYETNDKILEGTGSMIFDHADAKCYVALSGRANEELLQRLPIYHTNVMMSIGMGFALICLDAIDDTTQRANVFKSLHDSGKEVIVLSEDQINHFAGNMLQLVGRDNKGYLVMSSQAYGVLTPNQIETIQKYCDILHAPLDIIELCGGGSARCMLAEVFLQVE